MSSSKEARNPEEVRAAEEHGRVIARATHEEQVRIKKNMASADKRKQSMLRNAADKVFRNY